MKPFLITTFILTSLWMNAQQKVNFSSQNYIGLLEGEHGSNFQLQTINGIRFNTWLAGVGTGIDWYYRRSIPLFMSLNKDFFKKGRRNFYVAADGGVNFPWKDDETYKEQGYTIESTPAGIYWAAGLGYKIGLGKKNDALLLQMEYSYKHIEENVKNTYYYFTIPMPPDNEDLTNRIDYHLRRLSIKIGWNF